MLKNLVALLLLLVLGGCLYHSQQQAQLLPQIDANEADLASASDTVAPVPAEVSQALLSSVLETPDPVVEEPSIAPQLPYRGDFQLSSHPRVDKLYKHYTGNGRKTFGRWLERAGRYMPMIQQVFADEGVPQDLAYLAMIESGFNVRAYSWAHAAGPWQFIESTAKLYDMKNDWWQDERCDIEKATHAAAQHLKYLNERFDGDWYLAVAAYNAGGGKVRKAIRAADSRDFWALTEGKVLREETKNYLPKLIAALMVVKDLDGSGFAELEIEEPLAYETVSLPSSTDLEVVARLCDADYATIKAFNPALKRWSTPPE